MKNSTHVSSFMNYSVLLQTEFTRLMDRNLMGKIKMFVFSTHSGLVKMGPVNQFLYRKIVLVARAFWVSACYFMMLLLGFIANNLFRLHEDDSSKDGNSNYPDIKTNLDSVEPVPVTEMELEDEPDIFEVNSENDESGKDEPKFFFKFQFQRYEDLMKNNGGIRDWVDSEAPASTSTRKYEFMPGKGLIGFVEEPEDVNFTVKDSNKDFENGFLPEKDSMQPKSEAEAVHEGKPKKFTDSTCREEALKDKLSFNSQSVNSVSKLLRDEHIRFFSEDFFALDSDSESISSSPEFSFITEGFLSDRDFGGEFELDSSIDGEKVVLTEEVSGQNSNIGNEHDNSSINGEKVELTEGVLPSQKTHVQNSSIADELDNSAEEDRQIMEELHKLEESIAKNPCTEHEVNNIDEEDRDILEELQKLEETHMQNMEAKQEEEFGDKQNAPNDDTQNLSAEESEESQGLETLWEHQDLIEQLKMELKKVRATGLPTILEDSESPKIMEDLHPWKIDEKFQQEDPIDELHKFYKSYRERMRKFDILNYQKMYAIGFFQSKDPLKSVSTRKSAPTITSHLLHNLGLHKRKKTESDPMTKFISELHCDLEVVYVGQMCLSWEFLHWQYEKALELWEYDPRGIRRYNEVAGEFQQFQVLMQRFLENEPFEGPRVQNYVKNRCVNRNILQVPVIREDRVKDKKKARRSGRGDNVITSDALLEIIEESIRIFWRFVRNDKGEDYIMIKGQKGTKAELQDPTDSELLIEVRTNLQKKEKKLKELLRSGNCILKRFQKNQEDSSDHVLRFFSQVDMKLVARVLNMSKITTDQLVWCHNTLDRITFLNRKIHVEPSFLLFPC